MFMFRKHTYKYSVFIELTPITHTTFFNFVLNLSRKAIYLEV